jgi:hypothetical protein
MSPRLTSAQLNAMRAAPQASKSYDARSVSRRITNRRNKVEGEQNEKRLEYQHGQYARDRVACIERVGIPSKYVYRGGMLVLVPTGKAPIDFMGCFVGSGRYICMEAKHTGPDETSLSIRNDEGHVKAHQLESLLRWYSAGALVALTWMRGDTLGVLGAAGIGEAHRKFIAGEHKSIPRAAFEWLTPGSTDWLPVAKRLGGVA